MYLLTFNTFAFAHETSSLVFTDIAAETGFTLSDTLTETLAWGDYDSEGDEDLYLTSDGQNTHYRNDGNGSFIDVTDTASVGNDAFSVGTAFGDLDNDGDLDLYVVNFERGTDVLCRNDGPVGSEGEYVFSDITLSAGIKNEDSSRGMAFLGYDRDGLLDIYVNAVGEGILYHNLGNLQFQNVTEILGVNTAGAGVGVICTDLDKNCWIDNFTGNRSSEPNRLYLNDAAVLTDVTESAGITEIGRDMGVHC